MTSVVAMAAVPGRDAYTAAKGGVLALTRSMAATYAKDKVRVNAIAPCAILTDRVRKLIGDPAVAGAMGDKHLLGMGEPDDIANMALFLASDESRLVTGAIYPVDSGWTAL
jgi:NAD(P)-dependent dehydrogenase (short-subunit alcohol dehydrogenase family)